MGNNSSKSLDREEFIKFMANKNIMKTLRKQHEKAKSEEKFLGTFYACQLRRNRLKYGNNRLCYDYNRVILPVCDKSGDYINASYVDGWKQKRKYICTETPMWKTTFEFWKMVWLHRTRIIVMLCQTDELNEKQFYRYWDGYEGGVKVVKKFRIETVKVMTGKNCRAVVLTVNDGTGELHEMVHMTYFNCSKINSIQGSSDFLKFILAVRRIRQAIKEDLLDLNHPNIKPPVIVHCSSGNGISALFCATDISISQYNSISKISLHCTVIKLRKERFDTFVSFKYYYLYYFLMLCYIIIFFVKKY